MECNTATGCLDNAKLGSRGSPLPPPPNFFDGGRWSLPLLRIVCALKNAFVAAGWKEEEGIERKAHSLLLLLPLLPQIL